jgi:hypothetical protein
MEEHIITELVSQSGNWRLVVVEREDGCFTYRCQVAEGAGWGRSGCDAGVYDTAETAEFEARAKMAEGNFPSTIAWMPSLKVYIFKRYRRNCQLGTTGELMEKSEFRSVSFAYASHVAEDEYLPEVDFDTDFATLESETGFVTLWLSAPSSPE